MSTFKVPSSSVSSPSVPHGISRRRALTLFGAAAGFTLIYKNGAIALPEGVSLYTWEGRALGAPAKLTLAHYDRAVAEGIVTTAVNEIERLERVFSLHRANSKLSIHVLSTKGPGSQAYCRYKFASPSQCNFSHKPPVL